MCHFLISYNSLALFRVFLTKCAIVIRYAMVIVRLIGDNTVRALALSPSPSPRPIVSGCRGPTEKILQLIDMRLQPFVPKIKSYIKDIGDFIKLMESLKLPSNNTLATIDIKFLYFNIPHKEGIQAVLNTLYYNKLKPLQKP